MPPHQRLSEVYDRALSDGLDSLSDDERELYLIQDFILELEMSGLSGHFYNRLPNLPQIASTIVAMRKYGLYALAGCLSEAFELFEAHTESSRTKTWFDVLKQHDPNDQLVALETQISAIEGYGIEASCIK